MLSSLILYYNCSASFPEPQTPLDLNRFLLGIKNRDKVVYSLKAEARIETWKRGERTAFDAYIFWEKPDNFRVEFMSPISTNLSSLVVFKGNYKFVNSEKKECYKGQISSCSLNKLIGFPIKFNEMISAIIGNVPIIGYRNYNIKWDKEKGYYILIVYQSKGDYQIFHIKPSSGDYKIIFSSLFIRNSKRWEIYYSKFEKAKDTYIPYKIEYRAPQESVLAKIRYIDAIINERLPKEAWNIICPWGEFVVDDCNLEN